MNKIATVLLCINFITVLFPQPGYIHPDEFFQSSEIVAGDILQVSHFRAWEFNATNPVRSVVFPYLLMAPSLHLLQWMNSTSISGFKISAVKLVMATRLPVAFLSVFGYLATGQLATHFGADRYLSVVMWSSSYVTWTFFTRTFSNSVEAILFAMLLWLTVCQLPRMKGEIQYAMEKEGNARKDSTEDEHVRKGRSKQEMTGRGDEPSGSESLKTKQSSNPKETKSTKITEAAYVCSQECKYSRGCNFFLTGFLVVAGVFNRPTFILFAFVPVMYWFCSVLCALPSQDKLKTFFSMIFSASVGAFSAFLVFSLIDTLYFQQDSLSVLSHGFQDFHTLSFETVIDTLTNINSHLIVTPWNFFTYNSDFQNLSEHGVHPHYLHVLVNLPLLLGPLYFPFMGVCFYTLLQMLRVLKRKATAGKMAWLVSMALFPVLSLSMFPHQEPRFLIPCLPIMIVLGAKIFSGNTPGKVSFLALWTFFNIALTLLYGYIHQAALIPALSMYQQRLQAVPAKPTEIHHAIFLRTYPPPRHLLLQDIDRPQLHVHDLAGSSVESLISTIKTTQKDCEKSKTKCQLYVFLPSTVSPRVFDFLSPMKVKTSAICPHISFEAPPRFRAFWNERISLDEFLMDFCLSILKVM